MTEQEMVERIKDVFPKRMNSLIQFSGLTAKECAKRTHMTEAAVCRMRKGQRMPSVVSLIKLSRLFSVSPGYLLGMSEE